MYIYIYIYIYIYFYIYLSLITISIYKSHVSIVPRRISNAWRWLECPSQRWFRTVRGLAFGWYGASGRVRCSEKMPKTFKKYRITTHIPLNPSILNIVYPKIISQTNKHIPKKQFWSYTPYPGSDSAGQARTSQLACRTCTTCGPRRGDIKTGKNWPSNHIL